MRALALVAVLLAGCGKPAWSSAMRTVFPPEADLQARCWTFDDALQDWAQLSRDLSEFYEEGWRMVSITTYTSDAIGSRYSNYCFERIRPPPGQDTYRPRRR